jgi:hypothetical protein
MATASRVAHLPAQPGFDNFKTGRRGVPGGAYRLSLDYYSGSAQAWRVLKADIGYSIRQGSPISDPLRVGATQLRTCLFCL